MPFREQNGLRYYQFDIFSNDVAHGVFTRRGGVSPSPWHSLNLGGSVGDNKDRVASNRIKVFNELERDPASIHDAWLVHGTDIVYADSPRDLEEPSPKADILLTDNPAVSLYMRFGDCVPILYHDPKKKVIGLAHAGWMGTVKGGARSAVEGMKSRYGCDPKDIIAGIGPSIGVDHYEVGEDVLNQFRERLGADAEQVIQNRNGSSYLDLWKANEIELKKAGVEQIQISQICTACNLDDWYSHRAEKGKTGRFGTLLALA